LLVLGLMHFGHGAKCYTCFRFGVCWKGVPSIVLRVFDSNFFKARTPATWGDHIYLISLQNQVISRASRVPRDNFTLHLQTPNQQRSRFYSKCLLCIQSSACLLYPLGWMHDWMTHFWQINASYKCLASY
jgi:hypothetical protein